MDIYKGINIQVFNGSPVGRSRGEYLLDDESARKRGIWIMIIGRDQVNMISLNLKTLQLQRLHGITSIVIYKST